MKLSKATRPQSSAGGLARAESRRAEKEAATKIHPLDHMNVRQFEQMLAAKFGPAYLRQVPYRRLADGRFVPAEGGDRE